VERGRLRESIREVHLEHVTDGRVDERARHLVVERPHASGLLRREFPISFPRFEIHADHRAARLRLGPRVRLFVLRGRIARRRVNDGSIATVDVCTVMTVVVVPVRRMRVMLVML
jgi:hypothetical protein